LAKKHGTIRELADLIRANQGAVIVLDNDDWWIDRSPDAENPYQEGTNDDAEQARWEDWENNNLLARGRDYGYGGPYGRDVLEALALLAGIEVEDC